MVEKFKKLESEIKETDSEEAKEIKEKIEAIKKKVYSQLYKKYDTLELSGWLAQLGQRLRRKYRDADNYPAFRAMIGSSITPDIIDNKFDFNGASSNGDFSIVGTIDNLLAKDENESLEEFFKKVFAQLEDSKTEEEK